MCNTVCSNDVRKGTALTDDVTYRAFQDLKYCTSKVHLGVGRAACSLHTFYHNLTICRAEGTGGQGADLNALFIQRY